MPKYQQLFAIPAALFIILLGSCGSGEPPQTTTATNIPPIAIKMAAAPSFSSDSAYAYIDRQVAFGPRVPGTKAQKLCANWMHNSLRQWCDTVYRQETTVKAADGKMLPCINLVGVINPTAPKRILLLTHWDSRPWADEDTKDTGTPIPAADDGGSGTGVLLELARQIKSFGLPPSLGIDILLTDVEDYGKSEWGENSYCLGTQYWAAHPHIRGYKAEFGILLDMVGGKDAQFPIEAGSARMAGDVEQKVWDIAVAAGYSSWFPYARGPEITDDHVPVNKIAGIRTIDIIHLTPDPEHPFPTHWHTHADNMNVIDKATLKAVGETLIHVIYNEATPAGN